MRSSLDWRFLGVLAGLTALLILAPRTPMAAFAPLDRLTAAVTAALLRGIGLDVARDGPVLAHSSGFSFEIYYRCTGLPAVVFFAGLVLASRGRLWDRWVAAGAGGAILVLVNLLRLSSLFVIGVGAPRYFELAHVFAWEGVMVVLVAGLWVAALQRLRPETA